MAKKNKPAPKPTPKQQIRQLQSKGLTDKSKIVARVTGTKDGSGHAKDLTAAQLKMIGFSDNYILRVKGHLPRGGFNAEQGKGGNGGGGGGGKNNGGGGKGPGGGADPGAPAMPDPATTDDAYLAYLQQQADDAQFKYNQNAIDSLTALFDTYGLSTLAPQIANWVNAGMSESAIVAQLRESPEYKKRFPGMQALRSQGFNAISEAEYLQLEDSYHQALQSAGLPAGFYDQADDFVGFISNGVDPGELKQRANAAVDLANQVDPSQRELLSSLYGVGTGDIAAYFLDPKKATGLIQKQLASVNVASAARHAGIQTDFANRGHFERLVDNGIGAEQAAQGFSQIATEQDPLNNLAAIWGGGSFTLTEAEDATFFGNADAKKKRKRLVDTEKAAFSGASGFDSRVSGRGSTAGSF